MFFLTSLIFALILYVIPGALLLNLISLVMAKSIGLDSLFWLGLLHIVVYLSILTILQITKYGYDALSMDRGPVHKEIKDFLSIRGCRWINLAGILLIVSGAVVLYLRGALPLQFSFLFGAIVIGFADIFRKDKILEWHEPLPAPGFDFDEFEKTEEVDGKKVRLNWDFDRRDAKGSIDNHEVKARIKESTYNDARSKERYPTFPVTEYARYVKEGQVFEVVNLAAELRQLSQEFGYTMLEELQNVVLMVRSIFYASDQKTHNTPDYANFPVETIYEADKGSDCEDHAILAASILDLLGHRVGLFYLKMTDAGHLALGFAADEINGSFCCKSTDDHVYYYVETVPSNADIGEVPESFLKDLQKAEVIPL